MTDETRLETLRTRLADVRARIDAACMAANRDPRAVDLLVVTKTFPATDIALLATLGVREVAESRDQEARAKVDALGALAVHLRWHMIGQLQRNKAKSVAGWADIVESVDRLPVAEALAQAAAARSRTVDVLIQVNLDALPAEDRGGCRPADVEALGRAIEDLPGLRLAGVMAVAPWPGDPDEAFLRLAHVHERLLAIAPEATLRSAGMSGDLEAAIRHGATQVRVGSAILGDRPVIG